MKILNTSGASTVLLSLLCALSSCEKSNTIDQTIDPGDPVEISTEIYQKEVIDSANRFAFDLFKPVIEASEGVENIMISPFSISSALSMTLNGAAGETYDAMVKALRLDGKTVDQINETYLKLMSEMVGVDERVVLEIANSVWVEKNLQVKQTFMNGVQNWYKAEAGSFDATDQNAASVVNDWIAEKTHDKITNMLDKFDDGVAMLLINAIYFNGMWRYRFNTADTRNEPFYLTPATPKEVPMMHQNENLKAVKSEGFTLVDLPYGQGNYSMLIALPDEKMTATDITGSLTSDQWHAWLEQLGYNTHEVELSMPKFKYGYKRLLNSDLINLGMGVAFSDWADFSNICDTPLKISRVIHQSFIETGEEGTEAAAATIVEMVNTSAGPGSEPLVMKIDINRPFLFFIHENSTGTIIFMGRVGDPTIN
jgi:serine protease inhibitor